VGRLTLDHVYGVFHPRFVRRRMARFAAALAPTPQTSILDVGGTPLNWELAATPGRVTLLNLRAEPDVELPPNVEVVEGDGRALPYEDHSFDIAYSNSVIEHLGDRESQRRFAAELRRVGRSVWVQTPARTFPVEAHFLTPGYQFLPRRWQRRLARNASLWGLLARPSPARVDQMVGELRLLSAREMRALFPDCDILRERWLGLTKSYIAVRRAPS
jgi:hypothetical protein